MCMFPWGWGSTVCSNRGIGASVGAGKAVIISGGRAVLGILALDHSSSGSGCIEDVTAAASAASGGSYTACALCTLQDLQIASRNEDSWATQRKGERL